MMSMAHNRSGKNQRTFCRVAKRQRTFCITHNSRTAFHESQRDSATKPSSAAGATLGQREPKIACRNAIAALPFSSVLRGVCRNPIGYRSKSPSDWLPCRTILDGGGKRSATPLLGGPIGQTSAPCHPKAPSPLRSAGAVQKRLPASHFWPNHQRFNAIGVRLLGPVFLVAGLEDTIPLAEIRFRLVGNAKRGLAHSRTLRAIWFKPASRTAPPHARPRFFRTCMVERDLFSV